MKKVLALALALIMALSMGAMAFADETTTTTTAATLKTKCGYCNSEFVGDLSDHLAECPNANPGENDVMKDLTIKGILELIVDIAKASMSQWEQIENIVIKILDLIQGMGDALVSEADVKGAVADLEASLADVKDGAAKDKLANLLNGLKAKIKALYAGEKATDVTEVETPADTGSASVGIAVFAAVSVAAAAAYVCTKKD